MTRCPHCGVCGMKILDVVYLKELPVRNDYCGRCGKNWPKELSDRMEADGLPPRDDSPRSTQGAAVATSQRSVIFGSRIAAIAAQVTKANARDWKQAQGGDQ